MRRANGTGTITKLSGTRRRPYIAKYRVGFGADRRYIIVGYFATETEASDALAKFSFNPDPNSVSNMTFAEGFEMIKEACFYGKSQNTIRAYTHAFNECSTIHNKPIRSLKTLHYQQVIDSCKAKSKNSRYIIKNIMTKVCAYAIQNDIITKNYARFVIVNGITKEEQKIYTDDEIKILFKDDSKEAKQLLMLIYSGLRINEFANIRKSDIDLKKKIIIAGSKTKAGKNRVVPIHDKTLPFWTEFYNNADDLLFPNRSGGSRVNVAWRYGFMQLHKRLNIPYRTPHTARHTCASIMARDGVNPLYIKEILGHTRYSFTVDRYTHVDSSVLTSEINKMK